MDAELRRAWRRGAIALAVPACGLLLLAGACLWRAASRTLWDLRTAGVVTELNVSKRTSCWPTIEYAVGGKAYSVQTMAMHSTDDFAVGQQVTVLYPPQRPDLGTLDSFREFWPVPIFLSVVSVFLCGLAWKAQAGLPPIFHGLAAFALAAFSSIVGLTVFCLLCTPQGFDVFRGNPLVNFIGGALIFFGTVPVAALGAAGLWQRYVPARCGGCGGGVPLTFEGKRVVYRCPRCGDRL